MSQAEFELSTSGTFKAWAWDHPLWMLSIFAARSKVIVNFSWTGRIRLTVRYEASGSPSQIQMFNSMLYEEGWF